MVSKLGGMVHPQGDRTLLVVDDEPPICKIVAGIFEPEGFVVHTAADAGAAMKLLDEKPVGVAVIDKNLSGDSSGIDLLEHVSAHFPLTKSLILTGYASLESAIQSTHPIPRGPMMDSWARSARGRPVAWVRAADRRWAAALSRR